MMRAESTALGRGKRNTTMKAKRSPVELNDGDRTSTSGIELWQSMSSPANWEFDISTDAPLTLEEIKKREHWQHIDSVRDMVPFWRRGVEAAKRGEVLRMEDFLADLSQNPWGNPTDEWSYAYSPGEWDSTRPKSQDSWRIGSDSPWGKGGDAECGSSSRARGFAASSHQERGKKRKPAKRVVHWDEKTTKRSTENDAYAFVETFARQQAVNDERRRKMHLFFEMSTHDKISKIQEVIQYLQNT